MKECNYAFIDGQNVCKGIQSLGWELDWMKFRIYLKEKYHIEKSFIFIGYMKGNESLYEYLQKSGFICIFKPTFELLDGKVKGNVDAELVLHTMIEYPYFTKAIIVTGDGDFFCLAEYLKTNNKLLKILVPSRYRYSSLLKKLSTSENNFLDFMNSLKQKLEQM